MLHTTNRSRLNLSATRSHRTQSPDTSDTQSGHERQTDRARRSVASDRHTVRTPRTHSPDTSDTQSGHVGHTGHIGHKVRSHHSLSPDTSDTQSGHIEHTVRTHRTHSPDTSDRQVISDTKSGRITPSVQTHHPLTSQWGTADGGRGGGLAGGSGRSGAQTATLIRCLPRRGSGCSRARRRHRVAGSVVSVSHGSGSCTGDRTPRAAGRSSHGSAATACASLRHSLRAARSEGA